MYEVYGLIDPRSNVVFYVGCSTNIPSRLSDHRNDPASAAFSICQDLKASQMRPGVCIFGRFENKQDALALEAQLAVLMPQVANLKSVQLLRAAERGASGYKRV
jgi:hypothetical protein